MQTLLIILRAWSSSFFFTFNGGKIRTTFSAARIVKSLFSINFLIKTVWSLWSCIPINKPLPRISLIIFGYFSFNLFKLNKIQEKYPSLIKQIRGKGFLIGIQLYKDQTVFIKKLMDNKLLTIRAAENVVRILPPLNVKKTEINQALKIIDDVCSRMS